jgi:hypothetical protein
MAKESWDGVEGSAGSAGVKEGGELGSESGAATAHGDAGARPVRRLASEAKATAARGATSARRKLRLSPERRRALKLQGQYLGYMRQLKPTQKARVKALKARKGMRAAIAMARKMAKG